MGERILTGETEVLKKGPFATLYTTNPTRTDIGLNLGLLDKGRRLTA